MCISTTYIQFPVTMTVTLKLPQYEGGLKSLFAEILRRLCSIYC